MPKSRRYPITELPGTLQRSCREAQETFLRRRSMTRYGPTGRAIKLIGSPIWR